PIATLGDLASPLNTLADKQLNSFSLIRHENEHGPAYYYRASLAQAERNGSDAYKPHAHHEQRNKRFDGINRETGAVYIPLDSANPSTDNKTLSDVSYSRDLALRYLGLDKTDHASDIQVDKVTRFGMDYDFRNKRLPVYKVSLDTDAGDRVFIDPVTGIVVDHLKDIQRYEGLSFSLLHKWNFMMAFADRQQRDITIVVFLLLMLVLALLGLSLRPSKA
ncbi:MAG: hypothetical protein HRU21_11765, partial [Pseudomonadales bacterium]|nr:hypothetical protein [Pseudomonadales bacterium]